jgi:predicted PurR-regulated permease PerM
MGNMSTRSEHELPLGPAAVQGNSGPGWRVVYRGILVLVFLGLVGLFLARIPHTVTIFLIAALIAFGSEPAVKRLEHRMPKGAAISIVFVALTVIIVIGLMVVVPPTIEQTRSLAANVPAYARALEQWISGLQLWLQQRVPGLHVHPQTFDIAQVGSERLNAFATASVASLGTVLVNTATSFFIVFSALVLAFLFLLNDTNISEAFTSIFPDRLRETAKNLSAEISATFGKYISGQVTVSAITGVVVAGLSAILGFKLPLILFIVTFIGYSIPMIGMIIAHLIAAVLCAPQGLWMILWVQSIMFVVGRISDSVLVPKIMGESVGVSPIGIMLAVFAGGELFGFMGLLFAVPLAALIKILWRYFGADWFRAQFD